VALEPELTRELELAGFYFLVGVQMGGMAGGLQTVDLIIFHDLIATLMQEQTRPD
jgi:hypothetical protein